MAATKGLKVLPLFSTGCVFLPVLSAETVSNPAVDFLGERRTNESYRSTTDPESRLMRKGKGKEAKPCYHAHVLIENRNGLVADTRGTTATRSAEWEATESMFKCQAGKKIKPRTLGGDKGYDTRNFVSMLRGRKIIPYVAANTKGKGSSAIDGRTIGHMGYAISQRVRKRVEEIFGWLKTVEQSA